MDRNEAQIIVAKVQELDHKLRKARDEKYEFEYELKGRLLRDESNSRNFLKVDWSKLYRLAKILR